MSDSLAISCKCGEVTGTLHDVGPDKGDRYVCYCSDCRDFIHLLGRQDDVLDAHGGTAVYQTRVAKLELNTGIDKLATVRLTQKPTTRWYAACCNTPFFNTINKAKPPFLSVITECCDAERRDSVLGPSRGDVSAQEAMPPLQSAKPVSNFRMLSRVMRRIFRDTWSGDWKLSPLFDMETRKPITEARRVTAEERTRLDQA
ncbi:DUF6151 family protein [Parerythrobacter jejuensis]|uniref:CENP-V/GFA domain-containing protein n=1 Tax=Parerythrobacter jejuensis TaxID=795812 RepID=A0A845AZT0_9SPHN|nr:DUF6151 family protein [Parerythrobacter jejuensis]MXP32248.1 hypothetical protein [Parerythrobacter jejuensis]